MRASLAWTSTLRPPCAQFHPPHGRRSFLLLSLFTDRRLPTQDRYARNRERANGVVHAAIRALGLILHIFYHGEVQMADLRLECVIYSLEHHGTKALARSLIRYASWPSYWWARLSIGLIPPPTEISECRKCEQNYNHNHSRQHNALRDSQFP